MTLKRMDAHFNDFSFLMPYICLSAFGCLCILGDMASHHSLSLKLSCYWSLLIIL